MTFAGIFHPALTFQHPPSLWGGPEKFPVDVSYGPGMLGVSCVPHGFSSDCVSTPEEPVPILGRGKRKKLFIYWCPCCFPACQCSGPGQYDGTCDSETGQCLCRTGFEGHLCDQCAPGYFSYPLCQRAYLSSRGTGWVRTKPESSGRVLKED